ncbi:precorrin-3B C(17)-methyltransferase [Pseudofrankia sp. BMG5.37]|uniref:precorrin-3B C(17)-methyltransferase n=1 Tax=Pseudofrankia sp. BMG5.37 TaxID=3050035 RepID=UPI0028952A8B|nr:precorrin-3B C(17)-methyltransferase [Pseudofrankia sp. BMG5.37]MDT3446252.1 precorrin-3B C(17)-methyltransferase [Pseudofrankia sp. BMG5.37]
MSAGASEPADVERCPETAEAGPGTGDGTLYGVGVGPGDPELVTVKAARLIGQAEVVAYHAGRRGRSLARASAAPYIPAGAVEEELVYPVTRGATDHPGGYQGAIEEFYEQSAARLAAHLAAGRDVVLVAEGDPTLYSSFTHMQRRLTPRFRCVIIPGVTSVSATAAAAGVALVTGEQTLAVLPAAIPADRLRELAGQADGLALMKVRGDLDGVRRALVGAGRLDDALLVSQASREGERVTALRDLAADEDIPYMSMVLVPGPAAPPAPVSVSVSVSSPATADPATSSALAAAGGAGIAGAAVTETGSVTVVGLGPAGVEWLTPEAAAALAMADDIVGYRTYVRRVPARPGQRRHLTDNRVEAERAVFALDLARRGHGVAVVSSGDPGVFAMASAVLEARAEGGYADVPVRVLPGVTAANAVAARVGAPLGHDYCVVSLSDQLKPWSLVLRRLRAAAAADLVLALYNPGSKTRRDHIDEVRACLLEHRDPGTPVVVGRAVGGAGERVEVIRLADLCADDVNMRTLLIVGSSRTCWDRETGTVFTPRHHDGR